jgi:hypothetical protein
MHTPVFEIVGGVELLQDQAAHVAPMPQTIKDLIDGVWGQPHTGQPETMPDGTMVFDSIEDALDFLTGAR